jgi:hypothetical protein
LSLQSLSVPYRGDGAHIRFTCDAAPRSNTAGNVDLFILRCPNQSGIDCENSVLLTKKKRFVYRDRHEVSPTTSSMPPPPILSSLFINNGSCSKRGRSPNASELLAQRIKSGARGGLLPGGSGVGIANLSSYVESDRECFFLALAAHFMLWRLLTGVL